MLKRYRWVLLVPGIALAAALLGTTGSAGGGQETATGNNLSFPVIWGEGAQLTLRGAPGMVATGGEYTELDGVKWWHQQDPINSWQADSKSWNALTPVTWIDWGDNLESQDWRTTSKVRVETVLYKDLDGTVHPLMTGYDMLYLYGQGQTEMWGSNVAVYNSTRATVYSNHARLTIQRIDPSGTLLWDEVLGQWHGSGVLSTDFNKGAWEIVDGPGGYSAEINLPGKVIYGYNWDVRTTSKALAGTYRITFSLDASHGTGELFTDFDETTQIMPSATEGETTVLLGKGPGGGGGGGGKTGAGGTAVIVHDKNLTYIDVTIKAGGGGRR